MNEGELKTSGRMTTNIIRSVFITAIMLGLAFNAKAQTVYNGCLRSGILYGLDILNLYTIPLSQTCPTPSTPANLYAKIQSTSSLSCTIGVDIFNPGTRVTYTILNCPLDDFLPILVAPIILMAVIKIKKRI